MRLCTPNQYWDNHTSIWNDPLYKRQLTSLLRYSGAASRSEWTGVILPSVIIQPHSQRIQFVSFSFLNLMEDTEVVICCRCGSRWKNFRVSRSFVSCNRLLKYWKSEGIESICWFACVETNQILMFWGNFSAGVEFWFSITTACWQKM